MEENQRDVERAEEYEQMTPRTVVLGENKFEISTGIIIAARYADKLRRVALVSLSKIVPKDIIIRDISEFNKQLYDEIVNKLKIDKLSIIKITVEVSYNSQDKKLNFNNLKIIRYYTEDECKKQYDAIVKENEKLKKEIEDIKKQLADLYNKV
ncbi:DUF2258 domain-containing protein [Acidianus sulfidivorans JP7]|uniref:DUF2258 domain-containing protein n=1 Tax=Acidianus sulfidivorans JP7 TaxID=619593 RepID=A0A2U9IN31_9CREN|nr:single- stranded DNA-binding family protein [Acidianus sulfidivorans]AWR97412.1 DUF2258 domain-containing protein [Acidianus sulfidivorans JP7]